MINALTGSELINRLKSMPKASRKQQAIATGYVTPKGRAAMPYFYEAIANAQGLSATSSVRKKVGRKLSFAIKVQSNGGVFLCKSYVDLLGIPVGCLVHIKIVADEPQKLLILSAQQEVHR